MASHQGNELKAVYHAPVIAHIISQNRFTFLGLAIHNGKLIGLFEPDDAISDEVDAYEAIFNPLRRWPKGRGETPGPVPFPSMPSAA